VFVAACGSGAHTGSVPAGGDGGQDASLSPQPTIGGGSPTATLKPMPSLTPDGGSPSASAASPDSGSRPTGSASQPPPSSGTAQSNASAGPPASTQLPTVAIPSSSASAPVIGVGELVFDVQLAGLLDGDSTRWEQARDVAMDDEGAMYVVGGTTSPDFPVTPGAYSTTYSTGGTALGSQGDTDGFVTKIDAAGNIVWSTFLGGPNYDRVYAVEVDDAHNVYLAGRAGPGFPTTPGALQEAFAGDGAASASYGSQDGFVAKLSADGSALIWSTYFGDANSGFIRDIDIDGMNRVHLAATQMSGADLDQYVTSTAAQSQRVGQFDAFYARLSVNGDAVEYGTYLGGNDSIGAYSGNPSVRVLEDGTAYFLVDEPGDGAPTTPFAYQPNLAGAHDFLIAKFTASGSLDFCTYLGGSADESMDTHSLALSPTGNVIIGGATESDDFPVTDGSVWAGNRDVMVSVLSPDGSELQASTVLGGTSWEGIEGIGVDAAGNIYLTGYVDSDGLPTTSGALSATRGSLPQGEGLMLVMSADLAAVRYLSYDGLAGEYTNRSSIVAADGTWAIVGAVWQIPKFPATAGQDDTITGTHAAFFMKLKAQ
jgi:hypothetical protein